MSGAESRGLDLHTLSGGVSKLLIIDKTREKTVGFFCTSMNLVIVRNLQFCPLNCVSGAESKGGTPVLSIMPRELLFSSGSP